MEICRPTFKIVEKMARAQCLEINISFSKITMSTVLTVQYEATNLHTHVFWGEESDRDG